MNKPLLVPVLEGLSALIADELSSAKRGRFRRIAVLCEHAAQLEQLGADVADFADDENTATMDETGYIGPRIGRIINAHPRPMPGRILGDQESLLRELMMMAQPLIEATLKKAAPDAPRLSGHGKLFELLDLRKALADAGRPTVDIDAKIDHALTLEDAHDLVPADVLRRHLDPPDGQGLLSGEVRKADANGAGGDAAAGDDCQEQELGRAAGTI